MSDVPRVFISATSRDLGSCRKAVSDVLVTLNALPVVQDLFPPDYRTVVDMFRARIETCDAVICLVGSVYGQEPGTRSADQPRRSYTQLEYEIAVELKKPTFVFIATDDCPCDNLGGQAEEDELRGLQLEHVKRLVATDRLWMRFRSREDLMGQVRVMRFDPESLAQGVTTRLAVLMTVELVDSDSFRDRQGDVAWARDVLKPYHDLLRQVLVRWKGTVQSELPAECQVNFESADNAVNAALDMHHALRHHDSAISSLGLRIGVDMGQVIRFGGVDDAHMIQAGQVLTASRRFVQLARPGQTLLSRAAFDSAREHVRQLPFPSEATAAELAWEAYGRYIISGSDEPFDVCEVGVKGEAPLKAPSESDQVQRADSAEERQMRGWRPAIEQEIPRRPGWFIARKLGEGGFGEVWIARHDKTREFRVFKFCFDAARLSSFKRELTLFRLLRDALGNRDDIARLLEVKLDQAPFYLEGEYVEGGNLRDWSEAGNRLVSLPLDERLRLMAAIARAVAAAHSVGIIQKDLKPSNIFLRQGAGGRWQPVLADFGIGAVADRSLLEKRGITVAGFTQSLLEPGSSRTGTRMYQPPEANLARVATVQGDVYALGVMLFQSVVGDFNQPLGVGWERRLEVARARGLGGGSDSAEPGIALPVGTADESALVAGAKPPPLPAHDPRDDFVMQLMKEDINDCVIDDPAQRLASVAQLAERLETFDARVTAAQARRRAERAAIRMRRLRVALGASLVALVVVGGLAAFAFTQWRRAEALQKRADQARETAVQNEKKAEQSARQARASADAARQQSQLALGTLNAVIFDIQRGLENLPGGSPIRSRLLGTALKQLEKLSGEYVQHSSVDRQTAAALMEMADSIIRLGVSPADGRGESARELSQMDSKSAVESARRLYARASEILQVLVKADPNDAQAKRDLSVSYNRLGDVHLQLGATDKALESYRKDLELSEALAKADPNDAQAKRDLSISYDRLGNVHLQLGATDKALESYRKGLELREALAKGDPNDAQAKRDLSISYNKLGDVHRQLGATDKALESYRKGLELREALAKSDPTNVKAQEDLSYSYYVIGGALERSKDPAQARVPFEESLAIDRRLSQLLPTSVSARREVAAGCKRLSDLCQRIKDWPAAVSYAHQVLEHARVAQEMAGKSQPFQWDFVSTFATLGETQQGAGQIKEARQSFEEGIKIEPNSTRLLRDLAWLLATSSDNSARDGRRAAELATKACELSEWKDPVCLDTLAAACAEAGQFEDAVRWQKKALEHPEAFPGGEFAEGKLRLTLYESGKPYHESKSEPQPSSTSRPQPS
jgi:serine/threonine protein kinase